MTRRYAYAVALAAVAAALGLRALADPWLGERVPFITLFGAVIVAAWFGGARPALLAAAVGYLAADYLFVSPRGAFVFRGLEQAVELLAYALSSALIAALGGAMQAARGRAERSEGRFRAFMQHSPNSVFLKDEAGRYVFINRAAERLLGSSAWQGRTDADFVPAEAVAEIRAHDADVLGSDEPRAYDLSLVRPDGERLLHTVKFPLRDAAGVRYIGAITTDVTDQRRSEAQLQLVTDQMSAAVIRCAADTRILWVNRVYCRWMARAFDDIVGRPLAEVIGERVVAELQPHIRAVLAGGQPSYERIADYPGLGRRWVAATYTPTFGRGGAVTGWVAVVSDIQERKESEAELAVLLDALPAAVLRVRRDETFMWVNAAYARWLGRGAADIVGRRLDAVLDAGQLAPLRAHIASVLKGETVRYERLARLPGLGERWVRGTFVPMFDTAGQVSSWVVITADIHEEKRMEQALRDADRRKDEFIATLAHELRNPLAPIANAVALLGAEGAPGEHSAWARAVIARQVGQMSRLIDDLLDVARISSGKLLLRREPVALGAVLEVALETARPHIEAAAHRLRAAPVPPIFLNADATRLAQVFANLLNNAAKYTPPGGEIELEVARDAAQAVVTVADNGVGFPPQLAEQIFEPFAQWAAPEQATTGLGLGLALVRGIVALHGGSAVASSAGPGKGSRFVVRLPLTDAQAKPAAPVRPRPGCAGVRVMVADDNRDAADSLSRLLELSGHEVRVAYDGRSAIELASRFEPRVAIVDIGMPGADGYEVARELRRRCGRGLRLIALTGWGQEGDRRRAAAAGFDHHVTKPVDAGALDELIAAP